MVRRPRQSRLSLGGAVLAGGRARRLNGIKKGLIEIDGATLLERLLEQFCRAGIRETVMVANDPETYASYDIPVIADLRPVMGPMGGVEAGLDYFFDRRDGVVFVPCDLPCITAVELTTLTETFMNSEAPVVFARTGAFFWHPLCAVVHVEMRQTISEALDRGERKISTVWMESDACAVPFDDEGPFYNINRPSDLTAWQKQRQEAL